MNAIVQVKPLLSVYLQLYTENFTNANDRFSNADFRGCDYAMSSFITGKRIDSRKHHRARKVTVKRL